MIERGLVAGSCRMGERARGLVTPGLLVCRSGAGRAGRRCRRAGCAVSLGAGEQVVGAGCRRSS